jgi:hypothetical protein
MFCLPTLKLTGMDLRRNDQIISNVPAFLPPENLFHPHVRGLHSCIPMHTIGAGEYVFFSLCGRRFAPGCRVLAAFVFISGVYSYPSMVLITGDLRS